MVTAGFISAPNPRHMHQWSVENVMAACMTAAGGGALVAESDLGLTFGKKKEPWPCGAGAGSRGMMTYTTAMCSIMVPRVSSAKTTLSG